ncbi:hypothetical protein DXG03_006305 [Asterophora parasitica]|uniref:Uncharacterized protein n=1 Tax=Asterophora parasitica TaxID=117018 RepID=A0A9P7K9K9_9AGAR|nr:hypothetical protein DXG03_006305 [Asterophora parasitica]
MKSNRFRHSLAAFFHPLLRVLKMTLAASSLKTTSDETATHPIFPTEQTDVRTWFELVTNLWGNHLKPEGALFRRRHSELVVEEVHRYKEKSCSEHEFLVLKVRDWNGGYLYFQIERTFVNPRVVKAAHDQRSRSTPTLPKSTPSTTSLSRFSEVASAASTTSLSSIAPPPAKDIVTPVETLTPTPKKNYILIERTHFQDLAKKPTLLDILLISYLTHKNSDRYRLFRRQ